MTRAVMLAAAVLAHATSQPPPDELTGWASAYAPGVFEGVVRYRLDAGLWRHTPPIDWYTAAGYIATNDCAQVGQMATLVAPDGRAYRVLIADCGGAGEGIGAEWMTANNIIVELDNRLWERLTAVHGRPLRVTLR